MAWCKYVWVCMCPWTCEAWTCETCIYYIYHVRKLQFGQGSRKPRLSMVVPKTSAIPCAYSSPEAGHDRPYVLWKWPWWTHMSYVALGIWQLPIWSKILELGEYHGSDHIEPWDVNSRYSELFFFLHRHLFWETINLYHQVASKDLPRYPQFCKAFDSCLSPEKTSTLDEVWCMVGSRDVLGETTINNMHNVLHDHHHKKHQQTTQTKTITIARLRSLELQIVEVEQAEKPRQAPRLTISGPSYQWR